MGATRNADRDEAARLIPTAAGELAGVGLRLAVIGTPRSGNTWLRGLLAALYGLEEIAVHGPDAVAWDRLPRRCVIQIHQYPDPAFEARLDRHGIAVVSPARHPLDVMISALNFAQHTAEAPRWVDGSGAERTLRGASPIGPEFLDYACANHPGSVLTISPAWWAKPGVHRVRYEELVADPSAALAGLAAGIDPRVLLPVDRVVPAFTIDARRSNPQVWQYHFGAGRPGIWRELIPAGPARQVADRHRRAFEVLGYDCDPDPSLDDVRAERNWYRLQAELLGRHLADERRRLDDARRRLDEAHRRLDEVLAPSRPAPPPPDALRADRPASSAFRALRGRLRAGLGRRVAGR